MYHFVMEAADILKLHKNSERNPVESKAKIVYKPAENL